MFYKVLQALRDRSGTLFLYNNKRTGKQPSKPPKAEKRKEPKTRNKAPEPNQKEGPRGKERGENP
jgi:hypothetical protein